jgi:hypothetical protein
MTTKQSNYFFEITERVLVSVLHFNNVKRWVEYKPDYTIEALEVYCSPIMMDEKITLLKKIWPGLNITGNKNQSYILIKQHEHSN